MQNRWVFRLTVAAIVLAGLLVMGLALAYALRPVLLKYALEKAQTKLEMQYSAALTWDEVEVAGLAGVRIRGLRVVPKAEDTLLRVGEMELTARFWPLLTGKVHLNSLRLVDTRVVLRRNAQADNYTRFLPRKRKASPEVEPESETPTPTRNPLNFSNRVNGLLDNLFGRLPAEGEIRNLELDVETPRDTLKGVLRSLTIEDGQLRAEGELNQDQWTIKGDYTPLERQLDLTFTRTDTAFIPLNILRDTLGVQLGFRSMRVKLASEGSSSSQQVSSVLQFADLKLYHKRLNHKPIRMRRVGADLVWRFTPTELVLDTPSTLELNGIQARMALNLVMGEDTTCRFSFDTGKQTAQSLFDALPGGMCEGLKGIRVSGQLRFLTRLNLNWRKLDSLTLDVQMLPYKFRVNEYGRANLAMLNGDFTYRPYRGGRSKIEVSASNPNFVKLDDISPYLKQAVLSSEDGGFYYHNGFYQEAIRQALATNLKAKRFQRGGSTITMQLVKNVFLSHRKNLARKLEEALMVWLIESQRVCSKDRMLELYLNLIEWGPNVYGAKEAARFYFNKMPTALAPEEAIFLAMIIPQPNGYYYWFDSTGKLKPMAEGYFKLLGRKLVQAELLTEADTERFTCNVTLRGRAMDRLRIREKGEKPDESTLQQLERDMDRELGLDTGDDYSDIDL